MKAFLAIAGLAAIASPVSAQQVSIAGGDWSNIPPVSETGRVRVAERVIDDIAAAQPSCPAIGRDERHINLSVPILFEFSPTGSVQQIVVQKIGCPEVESLIGGSVLQMARNGQYVPTGINLAGWYRGSFDVTSY